MQASCNAFFVDAIMMTLAWNLYRLIHFCDSRILPFLEKICIAIYSHRRDFFIDFLDTVDDLGELRTTILVNLQDLLPTLNSSHNYSTVLTPRLTEQNFNSSSIAEAALPRKYFWIDCLLAQFMIILTEKVLCVIFECELVRPISIFKQNLSIGDEIGGLAQCQHVEKKRLTLSIKTQVSIFDEWMNK